MNRQGTAAFLKEHLKTKVQKISQKATKKQGHNPVLFFFY